MKTARALKNLENYIKIKDTAIDKNTITVEHRSNNPKRDYLFVNKLQCKHIPCSPTAMIKMCEELASQVNYYMEYDVENMYMDSILVVAFAETATGIGNIVAGMLKDCAYVMQTTREELQNGKQIITFEEEHSHATTQKLMTYSKNPLDLSKFKYVLFVEDEISTGNTILNFINAMSSVNNKLKYGVASICNWQDYEHRMMFRKRGIDTFALIRGDLRDVNMKMGVSDDMIAEHKCKCGGNCGGSVYDATRDKIDMYSNYFESQRLGHNKEVNINDFRELIEYLKSYDTIRVIGTEEFMSIPILIGAELERLGKEVICHATTRSKIDVLNISKFDGEASGIKKRHHLQSFYNKERDTYIYNTGEETECVVLMTDSNNTEALELADNEMYNIFKNKTKHYVTVTF